MKKLIIKYKVILLITFITLLGFFLRFYQLGVIPVGLNWDEVAWGYNAYSLAHDARDEFGVFMPLSYIESFGDFKPPLYAYVTVIPVMLFGLTEFATRFSSAFFGSLTVLLSFFLIRKLFWNSPHKDNYAYVTAFLLAVSPWHIMLSRAAFEANLVTFFLVLGVWLFLKGVTDKGYYLILSVIPFVLSVYTFNTARIVTPLLASLLGLSFFQTLLRQKRKESMLALLLGILLVAPLVPFLLSPQASLRFKEVNIFTDLSVTERRNQQVANDNNAFYSRVLHHRYALFGGEFVKHYLDHFNPSFLFITGDRNPKFSTQDVGQLYLFEIPFFIAGIFLLFRKREGYWWLVPLWIVIGIIPAATARETPHALRIESTLPMFQLLSGYGIVSLFVWLRHRAKRFVTPLAALLAILICLNISYFLHGYYMHYSREYSGEWQYGYKDSVSYVQQVEGQYDRIVVTEGLGRPYVYYLFYLKMNPEQFRKQAKIERDVFGFVHVDSIGKFVFPKQMVISKDKTKKTLYLSLPGEVPGEAKILKKFMLKNGVTQLVAFTL